MISALITDECSHWIARISQLDGEPGDVGFDDFGGVDDERMTPMAPMITLRVRPPSQDVSVVSNGRGV